MVASLTTLGIPGIKRVCPKKIAFHPSATMDAGELTLRGLVLPVGGVKDKLIAAHQAGAL